MKYFQFFSFFFYLISPGYSQDTTLLEGAEIDVRSILLADDNYSVELDSTTQNKMDEYLKENYEFNEKMIEQLILSKDSSRFYRLKLNQEYANAVNLDFSNKLKYLADNIKDILVGWPLELMMKKRYVLSNKYLRIALCNYLLDNQYLSDCNYLKTHDADGAKEIEDNKIDSTFLTQMRLLFFLEQNRMEKMLKNGCFSPCECENIRAILDL